jgi:hypothetical protein
VAATANSSYRLAKPITKPDGSIRQPFDALEPLKTIQRRIKERILSNVVFPDYLTGSLKGRDAFKNAELHANSRTVVCEDIAGFFPSTTSALVEKIWSEFFHFSPDVALLLTQLTTKDGALPQGAITSSHLANLAFFKSEHELYVQLQSEGISYSRYVDDITASSMRQLSTIELTKLVSRIYGMMLANGFKAKRTKQEIQRRNCQMKVTKLLVNNKVAIPPKQRQALRAAVYQLERQLADGAQENIQAQLDSLSGRIGRLRKLHPVEGDALRQRLKLARAAYKLLLQPTSAGAGQTTAGLKVKSSAKRHP